MLILLDPLNMIPPQRLHILMLNKISFISPHVACIFYYIKMHDHTEKNMPILTNISTGGVGNHFNTFPVKVMQSHPAREWLSPETPVSYKIIEVLGSHLVVLSASHY